MSNLKQTILMVWLLIFSVIPNIKAERTLFYFQPPTPPMPRFNPGHHVGGVTGCTFIDDGETLVTVGTDKTIRLWEARTLKPKKVIYTNTILNQIKTNHGSYRCVASHPSRSIIAVAGNVGGSDSEVRLIDLKRELQLGADEQGGQRINSIAFSPDGKWLIAGTGSELILWKLLLDQPKGKVLQIHTKDLLGSPIHGIRFPKQGNSFVYQNSSTTGIATITPEGSIVFGINYSASGLAAISSDGSKLAGFVNDRISVVDSKTDAILGSYPTYRNTPSVATFTADGKALFLAQSQNLIMTDFTHIYEVANICRYPYDICAAPNGLIAVVGGTPSAIYMIDSKQKKVIAEHQFNRSISTIGWHNSEPLKVAWGLGSYYDNSDGVVTAFDFKTMSTSTTDDERANYTTTFTQFDDLTLSLSSWRHLSLSNGQTRSRNTVYCYSFTKTGKIVFGGPAQLGIVNQDNVANPVDDKMFGAFFPINPTWAVLGHQQLPLIASGGDDGVIQIWNEAKGKLLVNLFVDKDGEWICWTPLGFYDASAKGRDYLNWISEHGRESLARSFDQTQSIQEFYNPIVVKQVIETQTEDATVIDQLGVPIPKLEGGAKISKLPFKLKGKGLPIRD